ncbi:thioredoxin family protein [uncultured Erythrobacter sp.]|uniref:thioredoxin family protein n=1 Tax=uncultured Erythrobacter sp. TaxID=263913 RepID=UPI002638FA3F|nr:thioredoxin family protein [uncultured Erythrobacter sp.]
MTRIFLIIAALGAAMIAATQITAQVNAAEWSSYNAAEFTIAQKKGKTIVVDVYSDGCLTCRTQAPILNELRAERQSNDVLFVKVNFDDEKDFLREKQIPRHSTVLVFKGTDEVARSIAETNRGRLRGTVLNAL